LLLSDYNSRRGRELTEAIETANAAALNVERVNGLVYAVVMESRGVYMSDKPETVKKFGDGLLKFNDQIVGVVEKWQEIVRADDAEQFATFKKRIAQFVDFRKELVRRGIEIGPAAGREWGDNDANRAVRMALNKDLEALARVYSERAKKIADQTTVNRELSFVLTCLGGIALVLVVIGVIIIARSIARPLSAITSTIKRVAEGAENVEVPHIDRADEIGALARAIQIFKDAMDRNRNLNAQVSSDAQARESRSRHIETSVEQFRQAIGAVLQAVTQNATAITSPALRQMPTAARRPPPAQPRRPQRTSPRWPAPLRSCRPQWRRSAGRSVNPPAPSSRPGSAPRNRSPKSRASRPRPSGSTAC
jgi:methyl-accepting chemotaxis protein